MTRDFSKLTTGAAREGVRIIRQIARPNTAQSSRVVSDDPWQALEQEAARGPQPNWEKGKQIARRGASWGLLLGAVFLGAVILLPLTILLSIGALNGSAPAAWVLGLVLLLGLFGMIWAGFQARNLLRPLPAPSSAVPQQHDENGLLALVREHGAALGELPRHAFQSTVLATRDALRATADEVTLSRAGFDARQAARDELPALLQTYRALPAGEQRDREFLEQLRLIESRMQEVRAEGLSLQQRQVQANRKYLENKYRPEDEA